MTRATQAFELLRAANPVSAGSPASAKTRRPSRVLVLAAILLCLVLVASAVAIRVPPLDFWSAEKAPPRVVQDFETLTEGAPPGMDPGAIPGETRKVTLADGQTLWVAPTRYGGFCTLGRVGGGCDKLGTVPLNVSWYPARIPEPIRAPPPTAFESISGYVNGRYADAVEIRFADGESQRLELAWVSEPIDVGFFHYPIPDEHRRPGHEVASVVALDDHGSVVTEDSRRALSAPPSDALLSDKRVALAVEIGDEQAVIWTAPTRYEGRCAWLEFRGKGTPITRCLPKGYERPAGFGLSVHALGGYAVLAGKCGYRALQFVHDNGSQRTVPCRDGLVLASLEPEDLAGEMQAIDRRGRPVPSSRGPAPKPRLRP